LKEVEKIEKKEEVKDAAKTISPKNVKPMIMYFPRKENVLARIRFPRFISISKERFGDHVNHASL
jgi:hypothetical protein